MGLILIQGFLISGLYTLVAIGFTTIYSVGRVLNIAHGAYLMMAGYLFRSMLMVLGLPMGAAFAISVAATAGISVATYIGVVRRFLDNPIMVFFTTFLLALIMMHIVQAGFGTETLNVVPIAEGTTEILGYRISNNLTCALIVSWSCIVGVLFFITRTHLGRAIRALAMDRKGAIISGINPDRVNLAVWAIAGALAGVAGIFYASYTYLAPPMWIVPLIMSFAIVVIGGLGSIPGAIIGAHIVGLMETTTTLMIEERLRGVFVLVIMIIVLVVRPKGLLGR